MSYIEIPNIPDKRVSWAIVDGRISTKHEAGFEAMGINIIKTNVHLALYSAISCHPDIVFHHLGHNTIVYAPGVENNILSNLRDLGFSLIKGDSELSNKYPGNICYNVARVGKYAFHNTKYTDKVICDYFEKNGVELVHVNQGYAKCSVSIVDENSLITMDKGIANAAEQKGIDVLIIEEDNILLPELNKGFIGGSSCLIDKHAWLITGNIETLSSANRIHDFLKNKGINIFCLTEEPVLDIGSVIPILTI